MKSVSFRNSYAAVGFFAFLTAVAVLWVSGVQENIPGYVLSLLFLALSYVSFAARSITVFDSGYVIRTTGIWPWLQSERIPFAQINA